MSSLQPKQRWSLAIGGVLVTLLLAAVFTFGSLDFPFEPGNWRAAMALYAVSSFITAALLVFGLILVPHGPAAVDRAQQGTSGRPLQDQDGRRRHGVVAAAGRVHVFRQLFAAEPHAGPVVSAAAGNRVGTNTVALE